MVTYTNAYDTQICVWAELPTQICVSYAFHDMCLTLPMEKVLLNSTIIKIERSFVNGDVIGQPNKVTNVPDWIMSTIDWCDPENEKNVRRKPGPHADLRIIRISVSYHLPGYCAVCRLGYFVFADAYATIDAKKGWDVWSLTHWGRDKMDAISQTTFWRAFSWMKMYEFRLKFHWNLFLRV